MDLSDTFLQVDGPSCTLLFKHTSILKEEQIRVAFFWEGNKEGASALRFRARCRLGKLSTLTHTSRSWATPYICYTSWHMAPFAYGVMVVIWPRAKYQICIPLADRHERTNL